MLPQTLHAAVLPSSDRGGIRVQYSKNPFGQRGLDASGFPGAGLYVGNGGAPSGALYVGAGATAAGNMLYNPGGGDRVAVAAAAAAAFGGMPPGLAPVDLVTGDAAALMNVGVASASMALPQMMGARQVMGGAGGAMQVVGGPRMAGMQPGGPNAAAGTGAYLGGYGGGAVQQAAPAALAAQPQPQLQGPPQ